MRRSETDDCEHRDHGFWDHWHVYRHAVAGLHAQFGECIGGLAHHVLQLLVGNRARFAFGVAHPVVGDLVTLTVGNVTVHAVHARVQGAVAEPLGEGQVPFECVRWFVVPHQTIGLLAPPRNGVGFRFGVNGWLRIGLFCELRARRKTASLI